MKEISNFPISVWFFRTTFRRLLFGRSIHNRDNPTREKDSEEERGGERTQKLAKLSCGPCFLRTMDAIAKER